MREYVVRLSDQADEDVDKIYGYIASTLKEPQTAERLYNRIMDEIGTLNTLPERYELYQKKPWFDMGLRKLVVGSYVVLYLVLEAKGEVAIARVFYGGMDISRQLSATDFKSV